MVERWLPVVGWEGLYEVSDQGRVRSLDRVVPRGQHSLKLRGTILRRFNSGKGYAAVALHANDGGKTHYVHRLVAATFIGPPPSGQEVRHLDGRKANCAASNLAYGTSAENDADKQRHGTQLRGEINPGAKLTEAEVFAIRRSCAPLADLAADYGVSESNVSMVRRRKTWRHV